MFVGFLSLESDVVEVFCCDSDNDINIAPKLNLKNGARFPVSL